jgi:hypothetical protein
MLKRLSEAISQSNIKSDLLASETYCPNHSSCNFTPKQNIQQDLEPNAAGVRARNPSGAAADTRWDPSAVHLELCTSV